MRAFCVAGARPNFMKIKPVMDALESRGVTVDFIHTGQHYDDAMSQVFLDELGIRRPDFFLDAQSGSHADQTARVMMRFEPLVEKHMPDVIVVVGDVNSTVACALVGAKAGARVAHVEAGLRSRDWSMPEEVNRVVADRVSDFLFAPSDDAVVNLRTEGYREDQIFLVGNVMIDTLLSNAERAHERTILNDLDLEPQKYGLVTMHRPANVDDHTVLSSVLGALAQIATHCPLVFPVHPRGRAAIEKIGAPANVVLIEPAGYLDFLALMMGARVVLTDSGGVQEETTALGVPCLTMRDTTERPITVTEGTNEVVGRDPERIVSAALRVFEHGVEPRSPELWDGKASERIADALIAHHATQKRPTDLA